MLFVIIVFTAISHATHTKSFKIQNLKLSVVSGCMSLFNTSIVQHVSAYVTIIRCIKIAVLLYTVHNVRWVFSIRSAIGNKLTEFQQDTQ
jgi:hypothetical protein